MTPDWLQLGRISPETFDIGIMVGGGAKLTRRVGIDVAYNHGLMHTFTSGSFLEGVKNRAVYISGVFMIRPR